MSRLLGRLRRVQRALAPEPTLQGLCEVAALGTDLAPAEIRWEAERVLAEAGAPGRSVDALVGAAGGESGVEPEAVRTEAERLLAGVSR